jgi:hypothetical protein
MIIISEPSADATRPVRPDRFAPGRRRSSAARNDTPRHADAQLISVHTAVLTGTLVPSHFPGIVLRLRDRQEGTGLFVSQRS